VVWCCGWVLVGVWGLVVYSRQERKRRPQKSSGNRTREKKELITTTDPQNMKYGGIQIPAQERPKWGLRGKKTSPRHHRICRGSSQCQRIESKLIEGEDRARTKKRKILGKNIQKTISQNRDDGVRGCLLQAAKLVTPGREVSRGQGLVFRGKRLGGGVNSPTPLGEIKLPCAGKDVKKSFIPGINRKSYQEGEAPSACLTLKEWMEVGMGAISEWGGLDRVSGPFGRNEGGWGPRREELGVRAPVRLSGKGRGLEGTDRNLGCRHTLGGSGKGGGDLWCQGGRAEEG